MTKSISVKLPDEDSEILEKILAEKQETVSGLFRKWVRENGEKGESDGKEMPAGPDPRFEEILTLLWRLIESKCDTTLDKNPSPETAKKIDEFGKLLSGFPSILDTKIQNILEEIGNIPKPNGVHGGVGIDPVTITKIAENIAKNTGKLDALEPPKTGFRDDSESNKWLNIWTSIAGIVVTVGIIGAYIYGAQHGPIFGAMSKDYQSLVSCSDPSWKKQKVTKEGENYLICSTGSDPKTGTIYGWRIKDLGGISPSEGGVGAR